MAKKKRFEEEEGHVSNERWLLTYCDLITLLMIFFIIMYSISTTNQEKFSALAQQLTAFIGGGQAAVLSGVGNSAISTERVNIPSENQTNADSGNGQLSGIMQTKEMIEKAVEERNLTAYVTDTLEERGYVISLKESLLFQTGSADINEQADGIINDMAQIITPMPNYVRVEGYTDNITINTVQYSSNWELASQRAINVAKLLMTDGIQPERISSLSYGEYRPIAPNTDETDRQMNRRVNIVILDPKYNGAEPVQAN